MPAEFRTVNAAGTLSGEELSEGGMKYQEVEAMSRETATSGLLSSDAAAICRAMLSISYFDPDREWVLDQLAWMAGHSGLEVRALVATCIGHVARLDRKIDLLKAGAILDRLAEEPNLRAVVKDAWEDLEIFVGHGGGPE